jgi:hypothetical protein
LLNLVLFVWLVYASTSHGFKGAVGRDPLNSTNGPVVARKTANNPVPSTSPTELPLFRWSEVESGDYRQYVANLRAIGCPEQTIRDLIVADLNALYAARLQVIWSRRPRAYWQKYREERPSPDQLKKLQALEEEKSQVAKVLLGFRPSAQESVDTMFLQVHGNEQQLLFLPEDRREGALDALREANIDAQEEKLRILDPNKDTERELFEQKLQALQKILTSEELEEFRLRNSPRAQWLRTEVQHFDCTPAEFKALLDLRDQRLGPGYENLAPDHAQAIADVRQVLGDERALAFTRVSDPNYTNVRLAADRAGLPADLADGAGRLSLDSQAAAARIANDSSLSEDEKRSRLEALRTQAEGQLDVLLAQQPAPAVRAALRTALNAWK